jgi:hypothetical protein
MTLDGGPCSFLTKHPVRDRAGRIRRVDCLRQKSALLSHSCPSLAPSGLSARRPCSWSARRSRAWPSPRRRPEGEHSNLRCMMSAGKLGTARLILSVGVAFVAGACTSVESSGDGSVLEAVDAQPQPSSPEAPVSASPDAFFVQDLASGASDLLLTSPVPLPVDSGSPAIDVLLAPGAEVMGAPPYTAACGQKDMVWRDSSGGVIRRDVGCPLYGTDFSGCYSLADDRCDGYRCLLVGTEFSSSCNSLSQCRETCEGLCIHIASQRDLCLGTDGGRPFDRD